MPTLNDIEKRARHLADALASINAIATEMDKAIDLIKRTEVPKLKKLVAAAAAHEVELKDLIAAAPELFVKPKTVTLHGIRCGFQKGKGGIEFDDADATVAAIQKHLPDMAEQLIRWTGKPLKEALNQLDVASLKKIGCRVVDTGEQVVVKPVDGAGVKMAQALLQGMTAEVA